jgi:hypothetical protein
MNLLPRFLTLALALAITPLTLAQQGSEAGPVAGSLSGILVDTSDASIARAQVKLSLEGRGPDRETQSSDSGEFSFAEVSPGTFRLSFTAKGFASKTISGELHAGEALTLPNTALEVDSPTTEINVTQTRVEIAEAQIKVEEKQRLLGIIPNFFVSYDKDAEPLTAKQKLELTTKTWFDPSSFVIGGVIAGLWQAENTHKGFGQGAQGYAKRYGASFADYGTSLLIQNLVTTTLFKQDPRYFYKGTGTTGERFRYAISRTFVCRGDNKKDQFCYSGIVNRLGSGFVTNYYYPAADRDKTGTILQNAAIGFATDALANIFEEFFARKLTRKVP